MRGEFDVVNAGEPSLSTVAAQTCRAAHDHGAAAAISAALAGLAPSGACGSRHGREVRPNAEPRRCRLCLTTLPRTCPKALSRPPDARAIWKSRAGAGMGRAGCWRGPDDGRGGARSCAPAAAARVGVVPYGRRHRAGRRAGHAGRPRAADPVAGTDDRGARRLSGRKRAGGRGRGDPGRRAGRGGGGGPAVSAVAGLAKGRRGSAAIWRPMRAGVNVLRYGNARDLCLGLEAVLPDGSIWHGLKRLRKDNTGYDLRHLLIGAEGTLGVITAASLRLFPCRGRRARRCWWCPARRRRCDLLALAQARSPGDGVSAFELIAPAGPRLSGRGDARGAPPLRRRARLDGADRTGPAAGPDPQAAAGGAVRPRPPRRGWSATG